jgi:hypothetical protein
MITFGLLALVTAAAVFGVIGLRSSKEVARSGQAQQHAELAVSQAKEVDAAVVKVDAALAAVPVAARVGTVEPDLGEVAGELARFDDLAKRSSEQRGAWRERVAREVSLLEAWAKLRAGKADEAAPLVPPPATLATPLDAEVSLAAASAALALRRPADGIADRARDVFFAKLELDDAIRRAAVPIYARALGRLDARRMKERKAEVGKMSIGTDLLRLFLHEVESKSGAAELVAELDAASASGLEVDKEFVAPFVALASAALEGDDSNLTPRLKTAARLYSFALRADPALAEVPHAKVGKLDRTLPDLLRDESMNALMKKDPAGMLELGYAAILVGNPPSDPGKVDQQFPDFRDRCRQAAQEPGNWPAQLYYAYRISEHYGKPSYVKDATKLAVAKEGRDLAEKVAHDPHVPLASRMRAFAIAGLCAQHAASTAPPGVEDFLAAMKLGHDEPDDVSLRTAESLHIFWREVAKDPRVLLLAELWARGALAWSEARQRRTPEGLARPGLPPLQPFPIDQGKAAPYRHRVVLARVLICRGSFDEALARADECRPFEDTQKNRYGWRRLKATVLIGMDKPEDAIALVDAAKEHSSTWKGWALKRALYDTFEALGTTSSVPARAPVLEKIKAYGVDTDPAAQDPDID